MKVNEKSIITLYCAYFKKRFLLSLLLQHYSQHKLIILIASFSFCSESSTSIKDGCLSDSVVFSSCGKLGILSDIVFKVSACLLMEDNKISVKLKKRGGRCGKIFMSSRIRKTIKFCIDQKVTIASV